VDQSEDQLQQALDQCLWAPGVAGQIDAIADRVSWRLTADGAATMAWEPIPLSLYGAGLPEDVRSSWVFILRAGATTGAERHPNSVQRVVAYRGCGDLQTWRDGEWFSHPLVDQCSAPFAARWLSIPVNVWHQAVVPGRDWVVVSFHTVPADELIEERSDPEDPAQIHQRRYLSG
jgi:hypothetical protein